MDRLIKLLADPKTSLADRRKAVEALRRFGITVTFNVGGKTIALDEINPAWELGATTVEISGEVQIRDHSVIAFRI